MRGSLRRTPFPVAVGLVAFAVFAAVAIRTPIDADEGFYALAADLVAHGRLPYRDFFYPQSPLYPFVLAPFARAGASYVVLRLVAAASAAVVAALVAYGVRREARSARAAVLATLVFVTHELTWQWLPTIRPYGVGEACALGAFLLATPLHREPRPRDLLLAGALFWRGAAVLGIVATLLGAAIAVAGRGARLALRRGAWFALGAAGAVIVVFAPFGLLARASLAYNMLDFHSETSKVVAWPGSRAFLFAMLGGGAIAELSALGTQNALLLIPNLVALALPRAELRVASSWRWPCSARASTT